MTTEMHTKLDDSLWSDLLGTPFVLHGRNESTGLDCLGLVKVVMQRQGLEMFDPVDGFDISEFSESAKCSADVSMFSSWGWDSVDADDARAGDLVLMSRTRPGVFDHLGIITEPGRILHTTPSNGAHVSRFRLDRSPFVLGVVRPKEPASLVGINNDKHFTFEHEFTVTLVGDPIFNPKSHEVRRLPWHEGLRVRDAIPAQWWENGDTAAVVVDADGSRMDFDALIPERGALLVLNLPTGLEIGTILAIISLILTVASIVYGLVAFSGIDDPSRGDDINSPTFKLEGIRNTALNGIPIPVVYGEHIIGGNIIQLFHTVEADGHQILNMLIAISHGPVEGVSTITSDVDGLTGSTIPDEIKINGSLASNYRGVEVSLRMGTVDQSTMPGFAETVSAIGYTWETTNATHFQHSTSSAVDGFQINFNCPGGLCEFDDGDVDYVAVGFDVYWRETGTTSWTALAGSGQHIVLTGQTRGSTNRYFRHDLPGTTVSPNTTIQGDPIFLDIKIERTATGNSQWPTEDPELNTRIDIVSVNEITNDMQSYPGLALLGVRVQSNEQFQGRTPTVTSVWKGRKLWSLQSVASDGTPTFDTAYQSGSGVVPTPVWGDSPADVVADLLLHPVYGLGRNGLLTADRLDWQSFYTWKTLCSELVSDGAGGTAKRAVCDTVLDAVGDGWEVVSGIARSAWGHLVPTGQQISVVVDDAASPVALLGMSDVNEFSVRYESRDTRPNVIEADFKNVTTDYESDEAQRVDDGVWTSNDTIVKSRLALVGVTRPIQAFRQCQFRLNWADKVGKVATFKAGIEAIHLQPGDVVNLSHRSVDWGVSGRVLSNEATDFKITLDKKVVLAASDRIVVRTSGTGSDVLQTATTVTTGTVAAGTEITLSGGSWDANDKPQAGDPYSMGSVTTYTKPFIISKIQTDESLMRTFEAVEYNAAVYDDDPGPISPSTDEFPNPDKIPARLQNLAAWEEVSVQTDGSSTSIVAASVERDITTGPIDFFWRDSKSAVNLDKAEATWQYAGRTNGSTFRFPAPIRKTTVVISAVPVSSNGVRGSADAGTFASVFIQGRRVLPTSPSSDDVLFRQLGQQIVISLPESPDPDFSHYSIKTGSDWTSGREITQAGAGEHHIKVFTDDAVAYVLMVKSVSRSGYESASLVSYTVPDPSIVLPNGVKYSVNSDTAWSGTKSNTQVASGNLELSGSNLTGTYVEELTNGSDASQRYGILGLVNCLVQQADMQWQDAGFTWLSDRYGSKTWDTTYYDGYEAEEVQTWDQGGFTWDDALATLIQWDGPTDVINSLAPTLEMSTSSNDGLSWSAYEPYSPGERTLDRVRLRLTLNRPATIYNPQADQMRTALTAWDVSLDDIAGVTITGANDQDILVYDSASGQWVNEYHDRMFIRVKNDTAGAFTKGQAVYVSGPHNANVVDVELADASDAAKMPCFGLLFQDLAAGAEGLAVSFGKAIGVAANFTAGDVLYVSPTTPGGLTDTKPTSASHLIQNVGILMQAHASNASVKVTGVGRSNDVPNTISISGSVTASGFVTTPASTDVLVADGSTSDDTSLTAGSILYRNTTDPYWKNTGSALIYDEATGTFKTAADASTSNEVPRLSQFTTAATGKGADLIAYDNATSGLSAALVSDAIDEVAGLRQFTHSAYRSGSFSNGQMIRMYLNTTDNDANFVIPAGQTLKVLAAYGRCKAGSTAGKTTWTVGIRTWADQAHTGVNDHVLASGFTNSTNVYINVEAQGTLASPLATIVGDDDPVGMTYIQHDHTGGGSSASDKHTVMVYGVFI